MRLTLRTLLAYIDGILSPNDLQDIGKKVDESEFATGLVHRIRDVMRRLRLGAPSLSDQRPGLDPNTVAEYLDNTLLSDRVTDFEKVCLESDVHLAEVASCHQILTLVLGEPAEIAPESRQRMYQLPNAKATAETPPPADSQVSVETTDVSVFPSESATSLDPDVADELAEEEWSRHRGRSKPTVPDYLRRPRNQRTFVIVIALCLLAVCLGLIGATLYAAGMLRPGTVLGNMLVRCGLIEAEHAPVAQLDISAISAVPESSKTDTASEQHAPTQPVVPPIADAVPPTGASAEKPSVPDGSQPPMPPETALGAATPSENASNASPPIAPLVPETSIADSSTATPAPPEPPTATVAAETAEMGTPAATEQTAEKPLETPATPPEPLGVFISPDQVLLADVSGIGWFRMATRQELKTDRLLAIPTYRPRIMLNNGAIVDMLGGTQLSLLEDTADVPVGVRIAFGRVVIKPSKVGMRIRVAFGDRSGVLAFDDAEAAALDVRRIHAPGEDPETEPLRMSAELFATGGNLSWSDQKDQEPIQVGLDSRLVFDGQSTTGPMPAKGMPAWILAEPISQWDVVASNMIMMTLKSEPTAASGLIRMTDERRAEVRKLALRCLGYVGNFHAIVKALNNLDNKTVWSDYVDDLRSSAARDPESARAIRLALERHYGTQASVLYRMLWGYTNDQLATGDDAKLVKALDSDSLPVRILSGWNLKDITGMGMLYYRPEDTAAKRKQPITKWEERLKKKEIRSKLSEDKSDAASRE